MNIIQLMIPKVSTAFAYENDSVRQGLESMRHHGYTAIPVLSDDNTYLGCITEGDFLRFVLKRGSTDMKDFEQFKIGDLLRKDFCRPLKIQASTEDVIEVALQQNFVPITDDRDAFCGIITRRSLLVYLSKQNGEDDKKL